MITIQISTQCYKINGNTLNTTFPFLFLQFFFIFCTCTLFFVVELISKSTKNNKNKHFDNLSLICCEFFFYGFSFTNVLTAALCLNYYSNFKLFLFILRFRLLVEQTNMLKLSLQALGTCDTCTIFRTFTNQFID